MNWESIWSVLKWVLAVLAAGFIGQFGRSFALRLLERRRRERAQQPIESLDERSQTETELEGKQLKARAKTDKKQAKAQLKREKKLAENEKENEGTPTT